MTSRSSSLRQGGPHRERTANPESRATGQRVKPWIPGPALRAVPE
jgi:hypothetical protein